MSFRSESKSNTALSGIPRNNEKEEIVQPMGAFERRIPNVIHCIFGLREDFGGKPFGFVHYLSIKSAYDCNQPDAIKLHYVHEPQGEWWEKSKPYVTTQKVESPVDAFGNPLLHYAHQADMLRLEILLQEGGIYLDLDVICLRSFAPLLRHQCVLGMQGNFGLCNAVILAERNAAFIRLWYDEYRTFRSKGRDDFWDEHSVFIPRTIARKHPETIHIANRFCFFFPLWRYPMFLWSTRPKRLIPLLAMGIVDLVSRAILSRAYCMHLWETVWWKKYLQHLTPASIENGKDLFSRICRRYISGNGSANPLALPYLLNYLTVGLYNVFLLYPMLVVHKLRRLAGPLVRKLKVRRLDLGDLSHVLRGLEEDTTLAKYDLGGLGQGKHGWKTVNLLPGVDIQEDILNIDAYCKDESVDVFYLSHTYEHLPIVQLEDFMKKVLKKLKKGGRLIVIQTDIRGALTLYQEGKIDFFCLRDIVMTPIDRRKMIFAKTGKDVQHHQFMWGADDLKKELLYYGFHHAETIDAGDWGFDVQSVFPFQNNEKYFGVRIPCLGVIAYK